MLKRLNRIINNMKIKKKLIYSYVSISIVTVLIIMAYLSPQITDFITENAIKETNEYTNTIKDKVKSILELAVSISDITYYEENLHNIVQTRYKNDLEVYQAYKNFNMLDKYTIFNEEIKSVRLYVDNPTLLTNSSIIKVDNNIRKMNWYNKAINDKGLISWYYGEDEIIGKECLTLVRELRTQDKGHIGVLKINVSSESFDIIIKNESYKYAILLDGMKVYSNNNMNNISIEELDDNLETTLFEDYIKEYREGNDYKILDSFKINKSTKNTFQILGQVSLRAITKEPMRIITTTLIITILVIIISIIVGIYLLKNFYERIDMLRKQIHNVVKGNFDTIQEIDGKDEIAEIYGDLEIMINSINKLIDDVYIKEIKEEQLLSKQKEIEFKMLSSQINPHFLYNTLETIRMRAFCNGDKELATIVKKLGKLMRRNLQATNQDVSLESEIDSIKDYLDIQSLRFGDKIKYDIKSSVDINKYKIMPLLLQPIVENAIVHGIEGIRGNGILEISIYEQESSLNVEISDNGCGITKEKLEKINSILKGTTEIDKSEVKHKSIGISNINERIKIFYGKRYGVRIFSKVNFGTRVIVNLPAKCN